MDIKIYSESLRINALNAISKGVSRQNDVMLHSQKYYTLTGEMVVGMRQTLLFENYIQNFK